MASNKNQHFVPRCYLRAFTIDRANKAINLFNIDRESLIERAAVKHQCSGDYFYGQDADLERAIQLIEANYSSVARAVQEPGYRFVDEDRSALKLFWLFQHLRTEAASRRAVEMTELMTSTVGLDASEFRLNIKDAVILSMQAFAKEISIVGDLKVCLIRNKSNTPFVTSDDPAILTNRWHIRTKAVQHISFGLQSAGILCLLPLSPSILMLAYDGDVYSVPHKNGWAELRASSDADAYNQHQYLSCRANIFIQDPADFDLIRKAYSSVAASRPTARHRLNYAVRVQADGEHERYEVVDPATAKTHEEALIHTQSVHPVPKSWPRQMRWRGNAVAYTNGTGIGYVRGAYANRRNGPPFQKKRIMKDKL